MFLQVHPPRRSGALLRQEGGGGDEDPQHDREGTVSVGEIIVLPIYHNLMLVHILGRTYWGLWFFLTFIAVFLHTGCLISVFLPGCLIQCSRGTSHKIEMGYSWYGLMEHI